MNREALLNQLRIDREAPPPPRARSARPWRLIALSAAIALASALAAGFAALRPDEPRVSTTVVRAAPTGAAAGGASVLDASGYVVARRQATVASKVTGRVVELAIEEGQSVRAGQIIARLDPSNATAAVNAAEAQAQAADAAERLARVDLDNARPRLDRTRALAAKGYLSSQALEDQQAVYDRALEAVEVAARQAAAAKAQAAQARQALADTIIRAPFSGVITTKAAQPGEVVSPGSGGGGFTRTGIGTIVDMDSLEVDVDVAENFINRVQAGMPVSVKLNAYPEASFPAHVIAVVPTADRSKATVSVRVGLDDKDPRVVPEMGAHVSFLHDRPAPEPKTSPLQLVPAAALAAVGGDQTSVVVIEDGRAYRRRVRLAGVTPEGQLVAGLASGERVVISPTAQLTDGQRVRQVREKTKSSGEE